MVLYYSQFWMLHNMLVSKIKLSAVGNKNYLVFSGDHGPQQTHEPLLGVHSKRLVLHCLESLWQVDVIWNEGDNTSRKDRRTQARGGGLDNIGQGETLPHDDMMRVLLPKSSVTVAPMSTNVLDLPMRHFCTSDGPTYFLCDCHSCQTLLYEWWTYLLPLWQSLLPDTSVRVMDLPTSSVTVTPARHFCTSDGPTYFLCDSHSCQTLLYEWWTYLLPLSLSLLPDTSVRVMDLPTSSVTVTPARHFCTSDGPTYFLCHCHSCQTLLYEWWTYLLPLSLSLLPDTSVRVWWRCCVVRWLPSRSRRLPGGDCVCRPGGWPWWERAR